jgi:hypothetical protein
MEALMDTIEMLRFAIHAGDRTNDHVILNALLMGELGESAHYLLGAMPDGFLERLSESARKANCMLKNDWKVGIKARKLGERGDRKGFDYDPASINEWWLMWCGHEGLRKLENVPEERRDWIIDINRGRFQRVANGSFDKIIGDAYPIIRKGANNTSDALAQMVYESIRYEVLVTEEQRKEGYLCERRRDEYLASIRKKRYEMHALAAAKEELAKLVR